jgi:hypothetical protein
MNGIVTCSKKKLNIFSRPTSRYSICTFSFCGAASLPLWASPWLRVVQVLGERMVASDTIALHSTFGFTSTHDSTSLR